ncbi:hypothetical protein MMC17_005831 [Xylographa soralifera]|nr:hypothetical protein [Xylographa soralifera]
MPIKWTSENDQLLLLKVLETHPISIDTKAVVAAWPTNNGEIPTPRAITERILKIRALAKAAGGGTSSDQSTPSKSPGATKPKASTKPTTPKTPRTKKGTGAKNGAEDCLTDSMKRKRSLPSVKLEQDLEGDDVGVRSHNWLMADDESPSKKLRAMHVEIEKGRVDTNEDLSQEEV